MKLDSLKNIIDIMNSFNITDVLKTYANTKLFYTINVPESYKYSGLRMGLPYSMKLNINSKPDDISWVDYIDDKTYFRMYKGTPIFLDIHVKNTEQPNAASKNMVLRTLNHPNHIKILKEFISKTNRFGDKLALKNYNDQVWIYYDQNMLSFTKDEILMKNLSSVFIPNDIKGDIISSLKNFINKREWYKQHNIPYHFGILLYGPPGTGKTSLSQALSLYFNMKLIVDTCLSTIQYPTPYEKLTIVLIEDIDRSISSKELSAKYSDKNKFNMASLLNCMDGLGAPENVIYIFTTNNIDNIDPALIRPGRIDLKFEIGYVTMETLNQFCDFYYGEHFDDEFILRDGLLFGELQTLVMKGYSMSQIKDYCKG